MTNLDLECAIAAEKIISQARSATRQEVDKLCTDASAVLSEHGLYACFLYLGTKIGPVFHDRLRTEIYSLLAGTFKDLVSSGKPPDKTVMLLGIRKLSEDLNSLLLAKRLVAQVLNYTRYHAKGLPDSGRVAAVAGPRQ